MIHRDDSLLVDLWESDSIEKWIKKFDAPQVEYEPTINFRRIPPNCTVPGDSWKHCAAKRRRFLPSLGPLRAILGDALMSSYGLEIGLTVTLLWAIIMPHPNCSRYSSIIGDIYRSRWR